MLKSKMYTVFAVLIMLFVTVSTFADTIKLKDGSLIKGRIVSFVGGKFMVAIGEGSRKRVLTFSAAEVESIEFDSEPTTPERIAIKPEPTPIPQPVAEEVAEAEPEQGSVVLPTAVPPTLSPPTETVPSVASTMKPISLSARVLADNTGNGWTNSGWVVKKGQRIRISGDGTISLGEGRTASPSGLYDMEDELKLLKNVPTGALIAVIGDDNNDFIYVGAEREFTAGRDGALFLGINEGNLNDNSGSFNAKIEIFPSE
ncbi:MAG: hypothetical protein WBD22_14760 [Pyrinomonadaceae bacterium]